MSYLKFRGMHIFICASFFNHFWLKVLRNFCSSRCAPAHACRKSICAMFSLYNLGLVKIERLNILGRLQIVTSLYLSVAILAQAYFAFGFPTLFPFPALKLHPPRNGFGVQTFKSCS